MALEYRIYRSGPTGGAVDYSAPFATVAEGGAAFTAPAMTPDEVRVYAVRVADLATGLEEQNVDARTTLRLDGTGALIPDRPAPVVFLQAEALTGGAVRTRWAYRATGPATPLGFRVWIQPAPGPIDYGLSPAATVAFVPGQGIYQATGSGLTPGTTCLVAVRAYHATATDGTDTPVSVVLPAAGPAAPAFG